MFIGDGAKLVRDCFALAKEKAPAIIFIDELDAVGTKRFDSEKSGDREVQRTMLELLNQLDGFASDDRIKVLAATNRVDVLDPALLRSGRLDRKIEFPLPNEEARAQILKIHSRKMTVDPGINWGELARSTDEFGGAMLKAVCVEAGMIALRSGKNKIGHEHYVDAIAEVQAKKKDVRVNATPPFQARMLTFHDRPSTSMRKPLLVASGKVLGLVYYARNETADYPSGDWSVGNLALENARIGHVEIRVTIIPNQHILRQSHSFCTMTSDV